MGNITLNSTGANTSGTTFGTFMDKYNPIDKMLLVALMTN